MIAAEYNTLLGGLIIMKYALTDVTSFNPNYGKDAAGELYS
jgi:hypothetical protein